PESKVYGTADPVLVYQVTIGSLVSGDNISGSLTRQPGEDVGDYAIEQNTLTASDNYDLHFVGNTLTITPAPLRVNVDSTWRFVGQSNPAFSGSLTGLKNGDFIQAVYSTSADATSPAGNYAIGAGLSGSKLGDYAVTVNPGTLQVIAPASI